MKKIISLLLCLIISLSTLCSSGCLVAFADSKNEVTINVKYCQSEARKITGLINAFRADNPWYYDSNNEKVFLKNLKPLQYDYDLEKAAMQRAAELALSYSHTRPNNQKSFSVISGAFQSAGENIAVGYTSTAEVFEVWKEENDSNTGQGHRRNMLSASFTAVAMACVYYNDYYYWVQMFRNPVINPKSNSANDSLTKVKVEIDSNKISSIFYNSNPESFIIPNKTKANLPSVTGTIALSSSWLGMPCEVEFSVNWTADNNDIIAINNGYFTSKKAGSCNLKGSFLSRSITVPVTIDSNANNACSVSHTKGSACKENVVNSTFAKAGSYDEVYYCKTCGAELSRTKKTVTKLTPTKTSLSSLKYSKGKTTVTWKKQTKNTSGYEIQYSKSSSFKSGNKTVKIADNKTNSAAINGLKKKGTYYFRIRTYKNYGGKKYVSGWSAKKSIKIK